MANVEVLKTSKQLLQNKLTEIDTWKESHIAEITDRWNELKNAVNNKIAEIDAVLPKDE